MDLCVFIRHTLRTYRSARMREAEAIPHTSYVVRCTAGKALLKRSRGRGRRRRRKGSTSVCMFARRKETTTPWIPIGHTTAERGIGKRKGKERRSTKRGRDGSRGVITDVISPLPKTTAGEATARALVRSYIGLQWDS